MLRTKTHHKLHFSKLQPRKNKTESFYTLLNFELFQLYELQKKSPYNQQQTKIFIAFLFPRTETYGN